MLHVSRSLLLLPFLSCLTLDRLNRIRDFISSLPAVATSNINSANHSLSVHQDLPIFLCLSLFFSPVLFFPFFCGSAQPGWTIIWSAKKLKSYFHDKSLQHMVGNSQPSIWSLRDFRLSLFFPLAFSLSLSLSSFLPVLKRKDFSTSDITFCLLWRVKPIVMFMNNKINSTSSLLPLLFIDLMFYFHFSQTQNMNTESAFRCF